MNQIRNIFSLRQIAVSVAVLLLLATGAFLVSNVELPQWSHIVSSINVVLLAIPAIWASVRWLGRRDAIILFAAIGVLGLGIETFALVTGFPYGSFTYSAAVGYRLFGLTPWTVAFAWTPLVLAAYAIAARSFGSRTLRIISITLILLAFDLVLDAGSVRLGFWRYENGGAFYGVPVSNFLGWLLSGAIAAAVIELIIGRIKPLLPAPTQLISSAFLIVFFWTFVALFSGMTGPFLIGVVILQFLAWFFYSRYYAFDDRIVVVDENNTPIRTARKLEAHDGDTPLHRAFSVFLFNRAGELLLQQRAFSKKTWPGVWSNSCCGHPMLHETTAKAAARRLQFELGIKGVDLHLVLPDFRYRAEKDGVVENELCPVFVGFYDGPIRANDAEVNSVRWTDWAAFIDEVGDPAKGYSPWAIEEVEQLHKDLFFREMFVAHSYQPASSLNCSYGDLLNKSNSLST